MYDSYFMSQTTLNGQLSPPSLIRSGFLTGDFLT